MSDIKIIEGSKLIAEYLGWFYIPSNELRGYPKAGWWRDASLREAIDNIGKHSPDSEVFTKFLVCRKHHELRFYNDLNLLFEVVGKIEEEDLQKYGYSWEFDGETYYNNQGLQFDIFNRRMDFSLGLELDPDVIISKRDFNYQNMREKLFEVIVETIQYIHECKATK